MKPGTPKWSIHEDSILINADLHNYGWSPKRVARSLLEMLPGRSVEAIALRLRMMYNNGQIQRTPYDPLKELEEWAKEHMKEWEWIRDYSSEHDENNVWARAKASSYKALLAKIAEMRENNGVCV